MATIGVENKSRVIEIDDKRITVQLWDTAGQERYKAIASRFFKGADGVLLVYDITKRETFEKVYRWMEQATSNANKDIPFVLIGNK